MKLYTACLNVDKNESNEFSSLNHEELFKALNIHLDYEAIYNYDLYYSKFKFYFVKKWLCSDTHVGLIAMYMNDIFYGCIDWKARRSDKAFYFANKRIVDVVKKELLALVTVEDTLQIDTDFFKQDIGEFFQVFYCSQASSSIAYMKDYSEVLGESIIQVEILRNEKPEDYKSKGYSKKVVIRLPNGVVREEELCNIYFKYRLVENNFSLF